MRPTKFASVSMPVTWREIEKGLRIEDPTIHNAVALVKKRGDLWHRVLPTRRQGGPGAEEFVKAASAAVCRNARVRVIVVPG